MPGASFDKSKRLLSPSDYQRVFDRAAYKVGHRQYLILARPNGLGHPRLGLIVSKKHLRRATDRNRLKRVARETFRHNTDSLDSLDIIFLVRQGIRELDRGHQHEALIDAWRRLTRKLEKQEAS
jgi:ribonuclease P protein component